jgi:hypothetical protein
MEIIFVVEYADWWPDDNDPEVVRPSNEVDERTIRVRAFISEDKAREYADKHYNYLKNAPCSDEVSALDFLAYLRIYKCEKQLLKDYK